MATSVTYSIPAGSNNVGSTSSISNPFKDDVMLESIAFGSTVFSAGGGQFVPVISAYVSAGRPSINAERGDNDTGSDGNPDPFERVGLDPADHESTVPSFQDLAIASAFSTLSLMEGIDGESGSYTFSLIFGAGITDNNPAVDSVPEVVLFERGNNDNSTIRAIIGGTYDAPVYAANSVTLDPGAYKASGIFIDTFEIGSAQELSVIGLDLNDFGTSNTIWGIEITSNGGDFYGQFLSPEDPGTQLNPNVPSGLLNPSGTIVPEPSQSLILILLVGGISWFRRR